MTDRFSPWIKGLSIVACASVFVAASCDRKKPDPVPATQNNTGPATTAGSTTQTVAATPGPVDVGPRAPAIFMLSSLKGYTEPCGCTLDVMLGGIDRIAGYVEAARGLYDGVTIVDGGDLFFETPTLEEHEIPQEKAKVDVVVAGLENMGVELTVPGERDFALGADYYFTELGVAGIEPIAANVEIRGHDLAKSHVDGNRLFIGIVDPKLYKDVKGVKVSDPTKALAALQKEIDGADVTVLLVHGEVPFAKQMLEAAPNADFALVGHGPRETDQVDQVGRGFTLEPYDQGRYLGILKLYNTDGAATKAFVDARPTSKTELEKVERQIEHVNESINQIPPATPGHEPEMLRTLRKRLTDLQARVDEIKHANVEVPDSEPAFLWRSIAMAPELPAQPDVERARQAYNAKLKELNSAVDRDVVPAPKGTSEFIGTDACATCHASAKKFWDQTPHSHAWATLVDRNKNFDQKCVGCHAVGYDQPGGSVIGKFQYDTTIATVGGETEIHKDLTDVGCEACHGPGSMHASEPLDGDGTPQHIIRDPTAQQCEQCHVPEHSPRFRFEVYVDQITGEGHARR